MPSGHSHSGIPACYLFVISHLLTTAIVAGEVTSSRAALASLFEGVIMNFKQKADGMHRAFGRVAVPSRHRWSAIGGGGGGGPLVTMGGGAE